MATGSSSKTLKHSIVQLKEKVAQLSTLLLSDDAVDTETITNEQIDGFLKALTKNIFPLEHESDKSSLHKIGNCINEISFPAGINTEAQLKCRRAIEKVEPLWQALGKLTQETAQCFSQGKTSKEVTTKFRDLPFETDIHTEEDRDILEVAPKEEACDVLRELWRAMVDLRALLQYLHDILEGLIKQRVPGVEEF